ncbi:MAG TPA: hypothetical protein VKP60_00075 [Magnetospirillaceae bacterium]|nr:hypothetical protein [Magnetospirillaceae bacterium]
MTTTTQSRTIDGIGYAASRYVYDNQGDGIVTDILYYDQSGTQVADRTLYEFSPFANSARIDNSDGTFSIKVTLPPGSGGTNSSYLLDTFSSAGIWIREDRYGPVFKDPTNPYGGISGYVETGYALINANASGMINGACYDMVISTYTAGGGLVETEYFNDLGGSHQVVARVYPPNPSIALGPTGTATAGTADTPLYASMTDPWAAHHAGSLALTISVDGGAVTGKDANGNAFTATAGSAAHLAGTVAQINADLASLSFLDRNTGTAHLTLQVYDQAGVSATATQAITVSGSTSGTGTGTGSSSTPNPMISGPATLTIPTDTLVHGLNATLSDPWAVNHAGSLALNVTTTFGTLTDVVAGHSTTGTSLHLTGTYSQIEADVSGLALTSSHAGSGTVRIEVYDQAGVETVHVIGVTAQASVSA